MSGVESTGNVRIYQGDDHSTTAPLTWTGDSSWPTLTSAATVVLTLCGVATYTAALTDGTSDTVTLTLSDTQTAAIPVGRRPFQLIATEDGETFTLMQRTWVTLARVTA